MTTIDDNPEQGNRGGQESGESTIHQSQRYEYTALEEQPRKDQDKVGQIENEEDKFAPGEPDDYNPDDFATD